MSEFAHFEMKRREFLRWTAGAATIAAALRAGDLQAAETLAKEQSSDRPPIPVINARDYGVKGDGKTDDLAAIENMFRKVNQEIGQRLVYFFPAGRYMLSDKLHWDRHPKMGDKEQYNSGCQFIGMGPTVSQFVLMPNAPGFDDPTNPKQMFGRTGTSREVNGFTLDGLGFISNEDGSNPGSIALHWQQHFGSSRDIVCAGGAIGMLALQPKGWNAVFDNVVCVGGAIGLVIEGDTYMFRNLTCTGFEKAGVVVRPTPMFSRPRGSTPTILNLLTRGPGNGVRIDKWGAVSIIGGRCQADPPGQPAAVVDTDGKSTFVNFETVGYREMVQGRIQATPAGTSCVSFASSDQPILPENGKEEEL